MTVMIDSLWSPPGFRNLSGYIQKTLRMEITERLVSPDLTCHDMEGFVDGFHRCLPKISRCQVFLVYCTLRTPTAGTIAIALQTQYIYIQGQQGIHFQCSSGALFSLILASSAIWSHMDPPLVGIFTVICCTSRCSCVNIQYKRLEFLLVISCLSLSPPETQCQEAIQ